MLSPSTPGKTVERGISTSLFAAVLGVVTQPLLGCHATLVTFQNGYEGDCFSTYQ